MKKIILGVFACSLFACTEQESKKANTPMYFDISGYFSAEVNRLTKNNPTVIKSVIATGVVEQKATKISDWKTELAGFSTADINKASWRGEFTQTNKGENIIYVTNNPKIAIKKIELTKFGQKVLGVKIIKSNENSLYTSTDTLLYYPDSLYFIQSQQKIKLLGNKTYQVTGKLK